MRRSMSIPSDHREPGDLSRYPVRIAVLSDQREPKDLPFIPKKDFHPNEHRDDQKSRFCRMEAQLITWMLSLFSLLPCLLTSFSHDRHRSVTGPFIGWTICAPVRRDSISFAFNAKYHFAGRSASSMSIKCGLCFSPSACRIIVS